ncbi:FtsP/CotA-like multicopper oxidase with cupredoxin domain [Friedmanniella endophytica]|uniref:FtsP/CotA-like multicopper oxidase with cupredoxin domain n=1 Tax=Microlunatus kandeliicorticis TaxID=1759536 RepID=A0A7W3IPI7_9ACTN|nr:multicopper oxidase family protein [Microlunatus kandeliicorticis]MBA8792879.1 FtsP/CotA-like multicopper oxidase with cupredoxin domain [Microlunatus kandeliicorticis]
MERDRPTTGRVVERVLRLGPAELDLGGRVVRTWAFDGQVPAAPIRAEPGDELRIRVRNGLPEPTTVHWHGLALRNDMDGVPDVTMAPIAPGAGFDYGYVVPEHPGTYWFHPHVGTQPDTGLYGPLIVTDPADNGYDEDVVLVLDDWTDGWGRSPQALLTDARRNGMGGGAGGSGGMGGMAGMGMPSATEPLGADTGDVSYPAHLINGRVPSDPFVVSSSPGRRLRLRLINAGADTAYRFAVGGHRLTVTHADGFPVRPVEVDTLLLGMGERYDVTVTAGSGVFPVVAVPEGKKDPIAAGLLRTARGRTPPMGTRPAELRGRMLGYGDLVATDAVALRSRAPDLSLSMSLTMADGGRQWLINGRPYDDRQPLPVEQGQRVRLDLVNRSMMFHPMHLHGHSFALARGDGNGPRKDTVNVLPMGRTSIELDADNPGQWLAHCHNTYHLELGMGTVLSYRT